MKYRQLNIDIHNPDGCYASTQRWYYDYNQYQHKSATVNRKYINDELKNFISAGYIIGNVYWADTEPAE